MLLNGINIGKRIAGYSNVRKAKVAAIAFSKNGSIIAYAHNRRVMGSRKKWTEHAEEVLIAKLHKIKAFDRFGPITILVMRITKLGISMAKPCPKCRKLLVDNNVKVMYTNWNGEIE